MFKTSAARVLVVALLVTMGFGTFLSAKHSWWNYHWARLSNPFTLKVGDNVSGTWDPHLDVAIADWHLSGVLDLTEVLGGKDPKYCLPTAGQIEVCNYAYGKNGWLGVAQVWLSGSHITQAVAKMNDTYFNTSTYNKASWRQFVICQEIGHDFGLDHQDVSFYNPNLGSCMDYTRDPDGTIKAQLSNEHPNNHDYEQLDTIYYGHSDSTTTVGNSLLPRAMPPAMGQIAFETPAQWGRLVRSNANGRVQDYELDFGGGHRVITHVFWADPDADGGR